MTKKEIKTTIIALTEKEQVLRKNIFRPGNKPSEAEIAQLRNMDEESTTFLNKVVIEFGLPTISSVGKKASLFAWLLVQHSKDIDLQKKYLALLKKADKGDVNPEHAAYLEDRLLMNEGKPQIYGTQVVKNKESGRWEPYKIVSIENVDILRKSVGLESLEDYLKTFNS